MSGLERFRGRTLGVATLHGKERVIGPALAQVLPVAGFTSIAGVDTDRFGAFSGEVVRTLDPVEACKAKAMHGAKVSGMDLVIASEGSFFPYPPAPFVPCDEEVLVLYDARDGTFFEQRHVSLSTVFGGEECRSWGQVKDFAGRMLFPQHGLVIRAHEKWRTGDRMVKGVQNEGTLRTIAEEVIAAHGSCWVETDMRAMMNPARMQVIAETAERLASEIATLCPACGACWFRITSALAGLPCELCGWPTESIRAYQRTCMHCSHVTTAARPDGKVSEDPMHCANCNP